MFRKMKERGYVNYEKYSGVTLTKKGEAIALEIHLRYRIINDFLMILDIDERTAIKEASEIQHSVSEETIEKLILFIDFVKKSKKTEGWIDHLEYFFKTGEYVECQPANSREKLFPYFFRNPLDNPTSTTFILTIVLLEYFLTRTIRNEEPKRFI